MSLNKLREDQARNRAIAYYLFALFAVIAAAHEIAIYIRG